MTFGRDTDIGYSAPEDTVATILVRMETLLANGITTLPVSPSGENLSDLISKVEESLEQLKRIRRANEFILGQSVEPVEEGG